MAKIYQGKVVFNQEFQEGIEGFVKLASQAQKLKLRAKTMEFDDLEMIEDQLATADEIIAYYLKLNRHRRALKELLEQKIFTGKEYAKHIAGALQAAYMGSELYIDEVE